MAERKGKPNPYRNYKPGSGREYDPNDPHFNPMHPPKGYPKEALEAEWGGTFDEDEKANQD